MENLNKVFKNPSTVWEKADAIIEYLYNAGLTPDQMLNVIGIVKMKIERQLEKPNDTKILEKIYKGSKFEKQFNKNSTMENKKPSDFRTYPWNSVLQNSESEIIAQNIMIILWRTGNVFRSMDWEEYKNERLKDSNFSEKEKSVFVKVMPYCTTSEKAKSFSKEWN